MSKRKILYTDLKPARFNINNEEDRQALGFFIKFGIAIIVVVLVIMVIINYVIIPMIGV